MINIASVAGLRGTSNTIAYSPSQGGVIGLPLALEKELAASGVNVSCVAPAMTETSILTREEPLTSRKLL